MAGDDDLSETISTPPSADWPVALELLFATFPEEERPQRIEAALVAVQEGRLDLSGLRWALQDDEPVGVSLTMAQPDGVTLVWPPVVTTAARQPVAVEHALLAELTARLDAEGVRLAQILLDPDEIPDRTAYRDHGFTTETDIFFLVRALDDSLPEPNLGELTPHVFRDPEDTDRFAQLVAATYQGSEDCRALDGLRSGAEAIASHRTAGRFDPALWWIYHIHGSDVACVLLSEHPDQSAVELVYWGVAPQVRGRGYGKRALLHGLQQAADRGVFVAFLAVDAVNIFANKIYEEIGFGELTRRQALFRWPGGLARK